MSHAFVSTGTVEWSDTDASGRYHWTAVFRWVENVEHELYRKSGTDISEFPRRSASAEYLRPFYPGDTYEVRLTVARIGNTSIAYEWEILSDGLVAASGAHAVVHVSDDGRASAVPDSVRAQLAQYQRAQDSVDRRAP